MTGQFYTTNANYILENGLGLTINNNENVIEPFAGQGDLIRWLRDKMNYNGKIEAYDIEPKIDEIEIRDTLKYPPDYNDKWIITNPPYLARNKNEDKDIYNLYKTNDLYKCFINSFINSNYKGGIIIIPAGFLLSPREIDIKCRNEFMENNRIVKIRYFEEKVFNDTNITIIAISFIKSNEKLIEQIIDWEFMPLMEIKRYKIEKKYNWIIGGEIYNLPINNKIKIRRYIEGYNLKENEQLLNITLNALDSGKMNNRIRLDYKEDYIYKGKLTSRTYATIIISGYKRIENNEQKELCDKFNKFLENKRNEINSLFLPQYRETKDYARKRIPFELAYRIINHLLD
jgi:hypothetical protein